MNSNINGQGHPGLFVTFLAFFSLEGSKPQREPESKTVNCFISTMNSNWLDSVQVVRRPLSPSDHVTLQRCSMYELSIHAAVVTGVFFHCSENIYNGLGQEWFMSSLEGMNISVRSTNLTTRLTI